MSVSRVSGGCSGNIKLPCNLLLTYNQHAYGFNL